MGMMAKIDTYRLCVTERTKFCLLNSETKKPSNEYQIFSSHFSPTAEAWSEDYVFKQRKAYSRCRSVFCEGSVRRSLEKSREHMYCEIPYSCLNHLGTEDDQEIGLVGMTSL